MANNDVDGGAAPDYRREGESYSSDLRDAEWARLEPMVAPVQPGGAAAQDRNAGGDERHSLFAAHRLPLAKSNLRAGC
jgi:hypothetical protein